MSAIQQVWMPEPSYGRDAPLASVPDRQETTGAPCVDCGGDVLRELTSDGYYKGRGHARCRGCRAVIAEQDRLKREANHAASLKRQPIKTRYVGAVAVPTTCACGCGESINEDTINILQHRALGMTFAQIAVLVKKSPDSVKQRIRCMPRYRSGHVGREGRVWKWFDCARGCGTKVYRPGNASHPTCNGMCVPYEQFIAGNCAAYDDREKGRLDREKEIGAAAHNFTIARRRSIRLVIEARERAAELEKQRRRALTAEHHAQVALARRNAIRTGSREHWESLGALSDEVAELLAEQKRDARVNQLAYGASLDARYSESDDGSFAMATSGAVAFDRDDDRWPYYAGQGRKRNTRSAG